jgi:Fe-S oxidoreductase
MDLKRGERINNLRVRQAHEAGADTIVTGCAYCMHMLGDSLKLLNVDESMRVIDIASLTAESLDDARK